jgi:hypothetical protein
MKIYISGKITGSPMPDVRQRFEDAEILWSEIGFEVANPLKNGLSENASYEEHLACDLKMLMVCDAIYMIDGWKHSRGAKIEREFAKQLHLLVYYGNDLPEAEHAPVEFARQPDVEKQVKLNRIQRAVFETTGLQLQQYATKNRANELVFARMLFVYQCRRNNMKLCEIKKYLKMTHSAMLYLLRKYNDEIKFNNQFRELAMKVNNILNPKQ